MPSFRLSIFCFCLTSTLVRSFHTVELLDAAQDILKSSTDLQAADLAKEITELKKAHPKELEERDLTHATEVSKLTGQVKALGDNLAQATTNAAAQQIKHAQAVKLAEDTLASHLDEINTIHDHVLGKISPMSLLYF